MIDGADLVSGGDVMDVGPRTGELSPPDARDVQEDPPDARKIGWVNGLPPDCPVQPLGRNKQSYHFINSDGQLIALKASAFNANTVMDLLDGRTDYALAYWPNEKQKALDASLSRDDLMQACRAMGVFNPENRVRGRGAWLAGDGRLMLHLGDKVWAQGPELVGGWAAGLAGDPGLIGKYVYEADEGLQRPWPEPVSPGELKPLLDQLSTWNWVRDYTAPRLLMGWIALSMIGGALEHRSHVAVQGDSGCGKSTLQKLIGYVLGPGKVQVADATEAGLSSRLRHQTLPVMFDEFEAEEDNRKTMAVIALMRRATSGGERVRGSSDHNAHTSVNQSPFFVSMITAPPLASSDLNRMAFLQLKPHKEGTVPWKPVEKEWTDIGRKLFRRMIDGWEHFAERQSIYSQKLAEMGHDSRGRDTIGNLLACADIALGDIPPDTDTLEAWTDGLGPQDMLEYEGVSTDFQKCIDHILQVRPERWRGEIHDNSIAAVLSDYNRDPKEKRDHANKALSMAGMTLVTRRDSPFVDLFIPSVHKGVRDIFAGTKWQGTGSTIGGWAFTLRSGPKDVWRNGGGYVDGQKLKGVLVRLDKILPRAEPDAGQSAAAADIEAGAIEAGIDL